MVVHPHEEDLVAVNVASTEAGEGMVRTATSAVKTRMATGEDMVPELEVKKAPRTERGALGHPTREAVEVGSAMVSLVMILRGHPEGTMSAIAVQAAGMR